MSKNTRQILLPVLAAAIWGSAFAFQSVAAESIKAFTFNFSRAAIAAVFLFLVYRLVCWKKQRTVQPQDRKKLLLGGLCCGLALTVATNLQQIGIGTTSAGKAGFITAMYMVLVPVFGLLLGKRTTAVIWFSVALASVGLYFLSINEAFTLSAGDAYVLLCAPVFAIHILLIDYFTRYVDGIALSCAQFSVTAAMSFVVSLLFERDCWGNLQPALGSILYVGVFSSGIAYTLQILAQKGSNPTVVSLLLSLESVFAVLCGVLLLHERFTGREILGCVLILAAVVLTQLPHKEKKKSREKGRESETEGGSYETNR